LSQALAARNEDKRRKLVIKFFTLPVNVAELLILTQRRGLTQSKLLLYADKTFLFLARLLAKTFLPFFVFILALNP
jgi:hypothetical protein